MAIEEDKHIPTLSFIIPYKTRIPSGNVWKEKLSGFISDICILVYIDRSRLGKNFEALV